MKEETIIKNRSRRWTLVNFLLAISPILFSILISLLFNFQDWQNILMTSVMNGTLLIVAISISGSQFLSIVYARDYEKLDGRTYAKIVVGFLTITVISIILFTTLTIANDIEFKNNFDLLSELQPIPIGIITIFILFLSLYYTIRVQKIKILYERKYSGLVIPLIDQNDFGLDTEKNFY